MVTKVQIWVSLRGKATGVEVSQMMSRMMRPISALNTLIPSHKVGLGMSSSLVVVMWLFCAAPLLTYAQEVVRAEDSLVAQPVTTSQEMNVARQKSNDMSPQDLQESVTETKYKDFFRHKDKVAKQDARREQGRAKQSAQRQQVAEKYEQARQNYVKIRRQRKEDLRDMKFDLWEKERLANEQARREKILRNHLARKNKNLSYKIPENLEYEIQPPSESPKDGSRVIRSAPSLPKSSHSDF